jgi:hypothetical protein
MQILLREAPSYCGIHLTTKPDCHGCGESLVKAIYKIPVQTHTLCTPVK